MRIYVADLAEYNNGRLVGKWITLPSEDVMSEVYSALTPGNEEWAIHDTDDIPFNVSEYEDIEELNDKCRDYEELSKADRKIYRYLTEYQGEEHNAALELIDDVQLYEDTSYEDLAEEMLEDGIFGEVPDSLQGYIDVNKIARDLELDYVQIGDDLYYSQYQEIV